MGTWRALLTGLILLTYTGCVRASGAESIWHQWLEPKLRPVEVSTDDKAPLHPISQGIPNGGFEDGLTGWTTTNATVLHNGASPGGLAPEGQNHLWVNTDNNVSRIFDFDIPVWQSISIRFLTLVEFAGHSPPLYLQSNGTQPDKQFTVPREPLPAGREWLPFNVAYTRLPDIVSFLLMFRSRTSGWWQGVDQVEVYFEGIRNSRFGEPIVEGGRGQVWRLAGGAAITEEGALDGLTSLSLPPGGSARQMVAHTPYGVRYFVTGLAAGEGLVVGERRETRAAEIADGSTSQTMTLQNGQFLFLPPHSPQGNIAEVQLLNGGPEPILVDRVSRGFTVVWPESFEPIENSTSPTTRFTAAWPGELASAVVEIVDGNGTTQLVLDEPSQDRDTITIEFDGAGLPAGEWTARFLLRAQDGFEVVINRPFILRRGDPFPLEVESILPDEFTAMPWIFVDDRPEEFPINTVGQATQLLQQAADDGYNLVQILAPPQRLATFVEAAEIVDMPFLLYTPVGSLAALPVIGNQRFDPEKFRELLDFYYAPFYNHPLCRGILLVDEPNLSAVLPEYTQRSIRHLARAGYPVSWVTLSGDRGPNGINAAVTKAHRYGFAPTIIAEDYERFLVSWASEKGRDFWFAPTAWGEIESSISHTPAQSSIMLGTGLAIGAMGTYTFLYRSLNQLHGLRSPLLEEGRQMATFRDFHWRARALSPLLREVGITRTKPPQQDIFVRLGRAANGDAIVFMVNLFDKQPAIATIQLDGEGSLTDAESGELIGEGSEFAVPLAAGEWRVFRLGGAEAVGFNGTAVAVPPVRTPPVQLVREMTTPDVNIHAIGLNPSGTRLSIIRGNSWRVHRIEEGNFGELIYTRFGNSPTLARTYWLDDARVYFGVDNSGFSVLNEQPAGSFAVEIDRTRVTTGGHTGIEIAPGEWWSSQSFIGLSRLRFAPGDTFGVRLDHLFPRQYGWVSLHGPFADDSIIGVCRVRGLSKFRFQDGRITEERLSTAWAFARGATSPRGDEISVGRRDQGLGIYTVHDDGMVSSVTINDPELAIPELSEWIGPDAVAVIDRTFGVRFYRRESDGGWRSMGSWAVPGSLPSALASTPDGRLLAVAGRNGTIYLLDTRPLLNRDAHGWILFDGSPQ